MPGRREGNPSGMMQDAVSMDFRRWKLGNIPEQWEGNPPGMTQDAVFVDFRRRKLGNMPERCYAGRRCGQR